MKSFSVNIFKEEICIIDKAGDVHEDWREDWRKWSTLNSGCKASKELKLLFDVLASNGIITA